MKKIFGFLLLILVTQCLALFHLKDAESWRNPIRVSTSIKIKKGIKEKISILSEITFRKGNSIGEILYTLKEGGVFNKANKKVCDLYIYDKVDNPKKNKFGPFLHVAPHCPINQFLLKSGHQGLGLIIQANHFFKLRQEGTIKYGKEIIYFKLTDIQYLRSENYVPDMLKFYKVKMEDFYPVPQNWHDRFIKRYRNFFSKPDSITLKSLEENHFILYVREKPLKNCTKKYSKKEVLQIATYLTKGTYGNILSSVVDFIDHYKPYEFADYNLQFNFNGGLGLEIRDKLIDRIIVSYAIPESDSLKDDAYKFRLYVELSKGVSCDDLKELSSKK